MRISIILLSFLLYSSVGFAQISESTQDKIAVLDNKIEIIEFTNIAYGSDSHQTLDVYTPLKPKKAPIILMVHGGAWKIGDKKNSAVVDQKVEKWVTKEGFIFASLNYRLLPTEPYNQADDIRNALIYIQKQAHDFGGNPDHIILMGHSAGAHLVGLVTANPDLAYKIGATPWLGSVLLDGAALNVIELMEEKHAHFYDDAFGNDAIIWKKSSPYHQLQKEALPMLLVCSTKRIDDPCTQAKQLSEQATSLGVHTQILEQDLSHRQINEHLGLESDYTTTVHQFIQNLLEQNL